MITFLSKQQQSTSAHVEHCIQEDFFFFCALNHFCQIAEDEMKKNCEGVIFFLFSLQTVLKELTLFLCAFCLMVIRFQVSTGKSYFLI